MKRPHKHAKFIKAWADSEVVQFKTAISNEWRDLHSKDVVTWDDLVEYRVKPEVKPDEIRYVTLNFLLDYCRTYFIFDNKDEMKMTFDGETGEIKSIERFHK